jgi:hypothetical protein
VGEALGIEGRNGYGETQAEDVSGGPEEDCGCSACKVGED